jgi:hypothetical protein
MKTQVQLARAAGIARDFGSAVWIAGVQRAVKADHRKFV